MVAHCEVEMTLILETDGKKCQYRRFNHGRAYGHVRLESKLVDFHFGAVLIYNHLNLSVKLSNLTVIVHRLCLGFVVSKALTQLKSLSFWQFHLEVGNFNYPTVSATLFGKA
jgi:hypothetical protein